MPETPLTPESVPESALESTPESAPESDTASATESPHESLPEPAPELTPEALLEKWRERFPKAFPADGPRPLVVGIHQTLEKFGYDAEQARAALALYVTSPAYLTALAADGSNRVNLRGKSKGQVSEAQRQDARHRLEHPDEPRPTPPIRLTGQVQTPPPKPKRKKVATIQLAAAQAKIALSLDADAFRAALDVDTTGAKAVPVDIRVNGRTYHAQLNPKSFRKAQAAFRQAVNPAVLLSGNLKGFDIEAAGLQVFDKGAKQVAEETAKPEPVESAPVPAPVPPPPSPVPPPVAEGQRRKLSLKPKKSTAA